MKVVEIFDSIQGEGQFIGVMCTFIRFAGCNLKCPFCDEESKYDKAEEMSVNAIVKQIHMVRVVLTGGEPTLQPELDALIDALHKEGKIVAIETNGTKPVPASIDWVTVSPKAPDFAIVPDKYADIKLVVDEDISNETLIDIAMRTDRRVWLQPCDGPYIRDSAKRILQLVREQPELFRAGIQLHKWYGER